MRLLTISILFLGVFRSGAQNCAGGYGHPACDNTLQPPSQLPTVIP